MIKKQLITELTLLIISIIFIVLGFIFSQMNPESWYVILFFGLAFAIGGFEKAKEGVLATIKNKSLNVEILMILAALGAFIVGDYSEGAILIMIFSISGVLESYATSKSEKALTSLLKLAPKTAIRREGQVEHEVPVDQLSIGDIVVVKVGEQVPVDGNIFQGATSLNQSAITGEFVPVYREVGQDVFAGSINLESTVLVETMKDPKHSVVQQIVDFVQKAQSEKTKSQSFIDRFEKWYVYIVILFALFLMIVPPMIPGWWDQAYAFNRGVIVLVVGSPCALVASITPAMLSALSNGARNRILIKGGHPLEDLIGVKAVMLDKTGTITSGVPQVVRIEIIESLSRQRTCDILYTLEKQSTHPLAKSIVEYLSDHEILSDLRTAEVSGHGMEARIDDHLWQVGRFKSTIHPEIEEKLDRCNALGHSNVSIIRDGETIGFVALMDTIRDQAKDVISELKAMGIQSVLLTGDHHFTARAITKEVGIDRFEAELLPEQKVDRVKSYQKELGKVLMIGDGINDAPALATADVSIAMGTGTDVSLETADIVIMNDQLKNIPKVINLAKRSRRITLQNIIFSVSVIMFLLISNVFGIIDLPLGVVAHEGSTILVILNSLRLLIK
ncbi:MAG: heavy metal translocating P-type ATPase [Acholeplasmataceae bacterium]